MDANFSPQLEHYLANLSEAAIADGLEPIAVRIQKMFGPVADSEPADLAKFCRSYIKLVPEQSTALSLAGNTLGLSAIVDPYVMLAQRYLDAALTELQQDASRDEFEAFMILLQGAYIFGRMQEELDDKVQAFVGVPLTHVNLMEANLMVHEILGDSFANRLDKVVASLIQQTRISRTIIEADLDQQQIQKAKEQHLSLTGEAVNSFAERFGFGMTQQLL